MKRTNGGETVKHAGFYLSIGRREFLDIEENQVLPGTKADTYYSVPVIVMMLAGPLIGLLYVMFLPFISLAMVASVLSKAIWTRAVKAERRLIRSSHRTLNVPAARVHQQPIKGDPLPILPVAKMNAANEKNRQTAA